MYRAVCDEFAASSSPSAADLKFLHHLQQALLGTSNRKAALDHKVASALCFRSSCQSVLRCITNFGNRALVRFSCAAGRQSIGGLLLVPRSLNASGQE